MAERGPNAAWAATCLALQSVIAERPIPKGINQGILGDWDFTINASNEPLMAEGHSDPIEPFGIILSHRVYIAFVALAPSGGMIGGGMSEDEFIAQMEALQPKEEANDP